jgi:prolipoprotein diacylglyceryltransferase
MTIDIDPLAFGVSLLPWTALLTIVGACGAILWMLRRAATFGLTPRTTYGIALRAALWSTLGGRLFHVIDHADFYSDVPFQAFYLWNGGLSLWGSLIVGAGGALWHAKRAGATLSAFAHALMLALLAIVLLVVLVRLWHRIKRARAIDIAFAGYAVGRFLIGFVTVERTVGGLDFSQWVALAVLGVISLFAVRGYARSRILDSPART